MSDIEAILYNILSTARKDSRWKPNEMTAVYRADNFYHPAAPPIKWSVAFPKNLLITRTNNDWRIWIHIINGVVRVWKTEIEKVASVHSPSWPDGRKGVDVIEEVPLADPECFEKVNAILMGMIDSGSLL